MAESADRALSFTVTPDKPAVCQPVTFTANVKSGVAPFKCNWSFGCDATPSRLTDAKTTVMGITYAKPGKKTVKVTVKDAQNVQYSTSKDVTVDLAQWDDISITPTIQRELRGFRERSRSVVTWLTISLLLLTGSLFADVSA